MTSLNIIEASLVLFWAGFIGLNVWLLRLPVNEGVEEVAHAQPRTIGKLHGEDYA